MGLYLENEVDIWTVESSHYNFGFMHWGFVLIKEDSNSQFDLPSVRVINHNEMAPVKLETLNLFGVGKDGLFQTIDIEQILSFSLTFGVLGFCVPCKSASCYRLRSGWQHQLKSTLTPFGIFKRN